MKTNDTKDAAKKKAAQQGKVIDIKEAAEKKAAHIKQLKKLQEVRSIARKMRIDTRNVTMTELIRAIQRAEGNKDCYKSAEALKCREDNCLWREDCAPS